MTWQPLEGLLRGLRSAAEAIGFCSLSTADRTTLALAAALPRPGFRGSAKVAVLTVVGDEFDAARGILGLGENIPGTAYFVSALADDRRYEVVLRKTADRTNVPAGEAVTSVVEYFRPAFIFLV